MDPLVLGLGGLGVVILLSSLSKSGPQLHEVEVNGRKWLLEKGESQTRTTTTQGGLTQIVEQSFIVYAPKLAFGPHERMPVIAFSQVSDNPASRRLTARYPQVPVSIVNAALKDFSVKETF